MNWRLSVKPLGDQNVRVPTRRTSLYDSSSVAGTATSRCKAQASISLNCNYLTTEFTRKSCQQLKNLRALYRMIMAFKVRSILTIKDVLRKLKRLYKIHILNVRDIIEGADRTSKKIQRNSCFGVWSRPSLHSRRKFWVCGA